MITVNGDKMEWREGLTVQALLDEKRYTSPRIVVKVNNEVVRRPRWGTYLVEDGDDVRAIHMIGGG